MQQSPVAVQSPAGELAAKSPAKIRTPLGTLDVKTVSLEATKSRVPSLDLSLANVAASIDNPRTHLSRLSQLSSRIANDSDRSMNSSKERESAMALKMKGVGQRIAKTKQQEDDRLTPLYALLDRAGVDIERERARIQSIDERLDEKLKDMKGRISADIQWLMSNRATAKARLNAQIATACELLKQEFMGDKEWARKLANNRWDAIINKVAAVIDSLEAECKNRVMGDKRMADAVAMKIEAPDEAFLVEKKEKENMIERVDEAMEEGMLKLQREMQEDKRERLDNAKQTTKSFREAMTRIAERVDQERDTREVSLEQLADKLSLSVNQLMQCIDKEAQARGESETQMTKLLEDMHAKLLQELRQEKGSRQETEQVLMKLLHESVEAIALRHNDDTLEQLQKRREAREARQRDREALKDEERSEWAIQFEEEKKMAQERNSAGR